MNLIKRSNSPESPWVVRFQHQGKDVWWSTSTTNKDLARKRAAQYRNALVSGRLDQVEQMHSRKDASLTVEGAIEVYRKHAIDIRNSTVRNNVLSLRLIVRECGLTDQSPIGSLTRKIIAEWQQSRISAAGTDQIAVASAKRSANSTLRQARSMFCRQLTGQGIYGDDLPDEFMTAPMLKAPRSNYACPGDDLVRSTWAAAAKLKDADPNAYRAFLLASCAGLRKSEIVASRNRWINDRWIDVRLESDFTPKGNRERRVPVPLNIINELRSMPSGTEYILSGHYTERHDDTFKRLSAWMRGLGWKTDKLAHELRKYLGAQIASSAGLYAAQRILGHTDPGITSQYYADLVSLPAAVEVPDVKIA